jgi:hypothetical protein
MTNGTSIAQIRLEANHLSLRNVRDARAAIVKKHSKWLMSSTAKRVREDQHPSIAQGHVTGRAAKRPPFSRPSLLAVGAQSPSGDGASSIHGSGAVKAWAGLVR